MTAKSVRILIADDHSVVLEGLAAMIAYAPDMVVVGQAGNGREAIEMFAELKPDVGLFDLRMPEVDGLEAMRHIKSEMPDARIVMLTTFDGDEDVYQAVSAGAKGYLLKGESRDELLGVIRDVHKGKTRIPPDVAVKLAERVSGPALSDREVQVLRLIANGKSNQEVARELLVAESTVKTHVNNILSKLHAADRTQAVTIALKKGILHLD